jgi:signal transduction histidine kinase
LRPQVLTEQGLAAALVGLAERAGVAVAVEVAVQPLPRAVEASIYFVCAEALTNVVKHAHASRAFISVEVRKRGGHHRHRRRSGWRHGG